ncbi:hypothetical protein NQ314_008065 [Rhamnusium bicolor]|uniref:Uncharacterized protein n=1 Tax=Rhamnusium bicolor TaxID=1586634 RepID=A0AAV8YHP9_9CUCU|nr:hypothetical protein NQ314_008065 [Rhamnusium bicolor]
MNMKTVYGLKNNYDDENVDIGLQTTIEITSDLLQHLHEQNIVVEIPHKDTSRDWSHYTPKKLKTQLNPKLKNIHKLLNSTGCTQINGDANNNEHNYSSVSIIV